MSDSWTNTVSPTGTSTLTSKEILDTIKRAQWELGMEPPIIKVPQSPYSITREPQSEYPMIKECEYIGDDDCYIVAGVGVIAGRKANEAIWDIGYLAVWE